MKKDLRNTIHLSKGYSKIKYDSCIVYYSGSPVLKREVKFKDWEEFIWQKIINGNLEECFTEVLKNTDAPFAIVVESNDSIYLATDNVRSKPLFYGFKDEGIFITDDLNGYQENNGTFEIDHEKLEEFFFFGFIFGKGTLYKDIYELEAGEALIVNNEGINSNRYFEYLPNSNNEITTTTQFSKEFNKVLDSVFSKNISQNSTVDQWIVPLSGGHDSRIIIEALRKANVENVLCYSYGVKNNKQSKISREVAEVAGYKWYFVEYTREKWERLHKNGIIDEYVNYSFQGVSTPHLQDFLAVHEMIEDGIISKNDIFLPGHSLDFIAGSHFTDDDMSVDRRTDAIQRVKGKFVKYFDEGSKNFKSLNNILSEYQGELSNFQEYINWQERQSKFIINSCRVYDYFGFDFLLPFWDKEFIDLLDRIDTDGRKKRKLMLQSEKRGILSDELSSIPFANEFKSEKKKKPFSQKIRRFIPTTVKSIILRLTGRKKQVSEGLYEMYSGRGKTIGDIIGPVEDFPLGVRKKLRPYLSRYPSQISYHVLSSLYALRLLYNKRK